MLCWDLRLELELKVATCNLVRLHEVSSFPIASAAHGLRAELRKEGAEDPL